MANTNKLLVPASEAVLNQMKMEIAAELGIEFGPNASARDNGRIGGEITRRLIEMAKSMS